MSPQRDLHYHFPPQGVPRALFPYLASFSQQHFSLSGIVSVCLFTWCLSHPLGAPGRQGPCCLVPHSVPRQVAQSMKVFSEWTVPFPVCPICLSSHPSAVLSVSLCFSLFSFTFFSDSLQCVSSPCFSLGLSVCLTCTLSTPSLALALESHFCPLATQKGTWNQPGWESQPVSPTTPAPVLFWPRVL